MKRLLPLLFLLCALCGNTQSAPAPDTTTADSTWRPNSGFYKKYFSMVMGYHGPKYHYAELGFAINEWGVVGHHPIAWALYATTEVYMNRDIVVAPKLGAWIGGGSAMGINLLYYSNLEGSGRFALRPEIGIGMGPARLTYGYNFDFTKKEFPFMNKHGLNLVFMVPMKLLSEIKFVPFRHW